METPRFTNGTGDATLNRRRFLATSALAGAGLVLAPRNLNAQNATVPSNRTLGNAINIAIVGAGAQGQVLFESLFAIAREGQISFRFKAVCDVWANALVPFLKRAENNGRVQATNKVTGLPATDESGLPVYKPNKLSSYYPAGEIKGYRDIGEMLSAEKDLDAIFVATPDHWHARHSIMGLEAGKHVYCEKMMARTVDEARQMVLTAQKTGKLLQIGHQRRSNPNYRYFRDILLGKYNLLGDVTNASGQWNRSINNSRDIALSSGLARSIDRNKALLKKVEMANAHEFRNWRWFKAYSNGPISDLGAHQIDIFNWVFGRPRSVIAAGGNDYYSVPRRGYKPREWYDNVMCIFDYDKIPGRPPGEVARAYYQVLTTTSNGGGYFETFMGDRGSLKISEVPGNIKAFAEDDAKPYFEYLVKLGALVPGAPAPKPPSDGIADSRTTPPPEGFELTSRLGQKTAHQFHIENFLRTIRGDAGETLNCDGAHAFESEAPIFRINEAVEKGTRIFFTDDDFALSPKKKVEEKEKTT
ncbi:MAG: Gfo/Idh/MocA family oxidoreductase [Puniceicoccales bacterium]|jgi:predicted dehydrogenase|nr:Gfo/Idh/MocA family oxidoreductase [Puniceicoccales bacterium]